MTLPFRSMFCAAFLISTMNPFAHGQERLEWVDAAMAGVWSADVDATRGMAGREVPGESGGRLTFMPDAAARAALPEEGLGQVLREQGDVVSTGFACVEDPLERARVFAYALVDFPGRTVLQRVDLEDPAEMRSVGGRPTNLTLVPGVEAGAERLILAEAARGRAFGGRPLVFRRDPATSLIHGPAPADPAGSLQLALDEARALQHAGDAATLLKRFVLPRRLELEARLREAAGTDEVAWNTRLATRMLDPHRFTLPAARYRFEVGGRVAYIDEPTERGQVRAWIYAGGMWRITSYPLVVHDGNREWAIKALGYPAAEAAQMFPAGSEVWVERM